MANQFICTTCKGKNVEVKQWVNVNTGQAPDYTYDANDSVYCRDCRTYTTLETINAHPEITEADFTRVNNDTYGNPRYVCAHMWFITDKDRGNTVVGERYQLALRRAKKLGGRKFDNKQYGGGIVFQSYNLGSTCYEINKLMREYV